MISCCWFHFQVFLPRVKKTATSPLHPNTHAHTHSISIRVSMLARSPWFSWEVRCRRPRHVGSSLGMEASGVWSDGRWRHGNSSERRFKNWRMIYNEMQPWGLSRGGGGWKWARGFSCSLKSSHDIPPCADMKGPGARLTFDPRLPALCPHSLAVSSTGEHVTSSPPCCDDSHQDTLFLLCLYMQMRLHLITCDYRIHPGFISLTNEFNLSMNQKIR